MEKQRKIAVEGLKRVSSICRKLLLCPVLLSAATGLAGSVAEPESSCQAEQVSEDLGRKEESWHRKKAQLNYPHPSSNCHCQLWPRTTPLVAAFMSHGGGVSLRVAFGFSMVTKASL